VDFIHIASHCLYLMLCTTTHLFAIAYVHHSLSIEDAGVTNWRGKTIGTYIGNFGEDWLEMFGKETQPWGIHRISGSGDFVVANRLSYEFDLQGPRYDLFCWKVVPNTSSVLTLLIA
jgi:hypothetical protein